MMASEKLFGLHATALQLRSQRMMMLASNIANAATPNYKARDLDFAKALDLAQQGGSTEGAIAYRVPVQASLDGIETRLTHPVLRELMLALCWELASADGEVDRLEEAFHVGLARRLEIDSQRAKELRDAMNQRVSLAP